ncbi:hypothetical protein M378DRAFT_197091 [Amanita muscaria Koide BX008]|uniref:J domain-containing protein n=1 Tax=Amanita muscaria (strain Koide BX008) TaxID=946122 RepID=A0A0C2X0R4_AMAMK|nr:hypothetical protein M378DRAFT_197091 [Amanita muscaria Koide BX008]
MSSYTVLGITPNATNDEVRLAYKHKALECHPDRNVKDKDAATRHFIEVNTAYHAILRERERKAARSKSSTSFTSDQKRSSTASESADKKTTPKAGPSGSAKSSSSDSSTPASTPKAGPSGSSKSSSSTSTHSPPASTPKADPSGSSKSSSASSTHSTPASTPSSSPFSTPASSPYSTPASSPASSTTSLPDDEKFSSFRSRRSATCEDVEDEDDVASTAGSSTTTHTTTVPPDPGTPTEGSSSSSSKTRRAKLRKPQPKPKPTKEKDPYHSSDDCECSCHHSTSSKKPCDTASTSHNKRSHHSKHHGKRKETELKEYHDTLPSLKDYPTADLAAEWTYPLPLSLEDIFHGKRLCYRITRRYLSGKSKGVVLDVDVPAGCRSGTKIVFRDAGHERRDGTKQDMVFLVQHAKHERFVRGSRWDGGGGGDDDKGESRERNRSRDSDSQDCREKGKESESSERKPHRRRNYSEEDLIMEVRLPWVDRLKDEKAKIVVSGIDGEELAFEVDCRNSKPDNKGKEGGKMTGLYVIEGAGMPVRANTKGGEGDPKSQDVDDVSGMSTRGKLIVRWEILTPTSSSSSKWESFKQIFTFGK